MIPKFICRDTKVLAHMCCVPRAVRVAYSHGYALGIHGSLERDLDLIAVPWVETASRWEDLAQAIVDAVGGFVVDPVEWKPFGRVGMIIQLGRGLMLDLSIMTRSHRPAPTIDKCHGDEIIDK